MTARLVVALVVGAGLLPAAALPTLEAVRLRMRANLAQIPNYTCVERIERFQYSPPQPPPGSKEKEKPPPDAPLELFWQDRIALEVAVVGRKELYSWPGAGNFEDKPLSSYMVRGALASGDFASHARALFVSNEAIFGAGIEESLGDQAVVRFDFRVPLDKSQYFLNKTRLGYQGSIWALRDSGQLRRVSIEAREIPGSQVVRLLSVIDYGRFRIAGREAVLPAESSLTLFYKSGSEIRNEIRFTGCRSYQAESTISFFEVDDEEAKRDRAGIATGPLPPGTELILRLAAPIDSETARAGDPVEATLIYGASHEGRALARRGDRVYGRIRLMERYLWPESQYMLGLEFTEIERQGQRTPIRLRLEEFWPSRRVREAVGRRMPWAGHYLNAEKLRSFSPAPAYAPEMPDVGVLAIVCERFQAQPGLTTVWRALPAE